MAYTKEDLSFKTLINKQTSSSGKQYYEEFGGLTINTFAGEVWFENLPTSPDSATALGYAQYYSYLVLANDTTVANNQTYFASSNSADTSTNSSNSLRNWISDKYGSSYSIHLYDLNNNEIFATDASGWFFDYPTGILTFNGSVAAFSKPFKISGYRYIGNSVYSTITSLSASLSSAGGNSSSLSAYASLSGNNTLSGNNIFLNNLILSGTPSSNSHAITLGYLNSVSSSFGSPTGGLTSVFVTLTTNQTVSGTKLFVGDGLIFGGIGNTNSTTGNSFNTIIGGLSGNISNQNRLTTIIGGQQNEFSGTGNEDSVIIGGSENKFTGRHTYSVIIGGERNSFSGNGQYTTIVGGYSNIINGSFYSGIFNSTNSVISHTSNPASNANNTVLGGYRNNIYEDSGNNVIMGGNDHNIINSSNNIIFGGQITSITSGINNSYLFGTGYQNIDSSFNYLDNPISNSLLLGWSAQPYFWSAQDTGTSAFMDWYYFGPVTSDYHFINRLYLDSITASIINPLTASYVTLGTEQTINGKKTVDISTHDFTLYQQTSLQEINYIGGEYTLPTIPFNENSTLDVTFYLSISGIPSVPGLLLTLENFADPYNLYMNYDIDEFGNLNVNSSDGGATFNKSQDISSYLDGQYHKFRLNSYGTNWYRYWKLFINDVEIYSQVSMVGYYYNFDTYKLFSETSPLSGTPVYFKSLTGTWAFGSFYDSLSALTTNGGEIGYITDPINSGFIVGNPNLYNTGIINSTNNSTIFSTNGTSSHSNFYYFGSTTGSKNVITREYLDSITGSLTGSGGTATGNYVSLTATETISGDKSFLNNISLSATPTLTQHVINKGYVDTASSNLNSRIIGLSSTLTSFYVSKTSTETISGNKSFLNNIVLSATPSAMNHVITLRVLTSATSSLNSTINSASSNLNSQINNVSGNLISYVNSNTSSLFSTITSVSSNLNSQINNVSGNLVSYVNSNTSSLFSTITSVSSNLNSSILNLSGSFVTLNTDQTVSGDKSFLNNISLSSTPTLNQHVITLGYLNSVTGSFGSPIDYNVLNSYYVSLSADQTISGDKSFLNNISLSATPSLSQHVITKGYLDSITSQFGGSVASGTFVSLTASESISGIKTFTDTISGNIDYGSITGDLLGYIDYINLSSSITSVTVFMSATANVSANQVVVINNTNGSLYNTDHRILTVSPSDGSASSFTIATVYNSLTSITGGYVSTTASKNLINFGMSGQSVYSVLNTNYRSPFINAPVYMFDPNVLNLYDMWLVKSPTTNILMMKIKMDDGIYGVELSKL